MGDGDHYDTCCCCGTEYLARAMHQQTYGPNPIFMCERCFCMRHGSDMDDYDYQTYEDWQ